MEINATVVHEFNNLLTVIMGYTEMILCDPTLAGPARRYAEAIEEAADRAALLSKTMTRANTAHA
ncbi:MAG: histidine kinase dimerization/phospho-acceptor domain-containing protein [Bryobacteraceae bacterium]